MLVAKFLGSCIYRVVRYLVVFWAYMIFVILPFVKTPGSDLLYPTLGWTLVAVAACFVFVARDLTWLFRKAGFI